MRRPLAWQEVAAAVEARLVNTDGDVLVVYSALSLHQHVAVTVGVDELVGMSLRGLDGELRHVVGAEVGLVQEGRLPLDTDDVLHLRDEPSDVLGAERGPVCSVDGLLHSLVEGLDLVGSEVRQHACQIACLEEVFLQPVDKKLQVGIHGIDVCL